MSNRTLVTLTLLAAVFCTVVVATIKNWNDREPIALSESLADPSKSKAKPPVQKKPLNEVLGLKSDEMVEVGGILRPKRDMNFTKQKQPKNSVSPLPNPGKAPFLQGDENPQVAGLFAELQQEQPLAAAQSVLFAPEPFDLASYQKDPETYLNKIRPGRVFQSAQPGPESQPIEPIGKTYQEVIQGERVVLQVKAKPSMPVTFHTQQLGEFENRLKTISVAANEEGVAEVKYLAGPGTIGLINILAASPVHAEDVHFMVDVALPD